jgi:DNA (cytosine-5)-methyltransferase 1
MTAKKVKKEHNMPTFAEFFAGIGLVRMGLERHGWVAVFANDNSPQKYEMYLAQFPDAEQHFLLEDIKRLTAAQIPTVNMATASFPCNDLSLAGRRAGLNGTQSGTFWNFIRLLEGMQERRPPLILIENVVGFLKSHHGWDFEIALRALNDLGYNVDSFIVDATHFVPQSRPRLFIVGCMQHPQPNGNEVQISDLRTKDLVKFMNSHPDLQWNIRQLPPLPPTNRNSLSSMLEDLPEGDPEWWNLERTEYLLNQMSDRHRVVANHMINSTTWSYGTVFRRMRNSRSTAELRVDGIAGCLRTPRGGSAKQILFKAGYGRYFARYITPRECARLMGTDNYRITVPRDQALFGFGDAVCVSAIAWIAENYLNPLLQEIEQGQPAQEQVEQLVLFA